MDMLEHLMQEHRKAEELLAVLAESDPGPEREATLAELDEALQVHMAVEERFLYPLVESALDEEMSEEAEVEHNLARDALTSLRELQREPGFGAAVAMLRAGIGHHVREEEQEIFPQLRQEAAEDVATLDPEEAEQAVRADLETIDLTREELYERAKQADVPGRSQMTKDELARALQGQS
jgi:hemerythrin-like domain-containing protein